MSQDAGFDASGFGVKTLKEFKRRAARLYLRAFGSTPGSDLQALAGNYICVTDQHGMNEITEDPLWRDKIIRSGDASDSSKLIKGWFGEFEQVLLVKSDRMRTVDIGPSGDPFEGHEAIFMAADPVLIDPGEDGVQGFMGEFPVVLAMLGLPEVKKASEDNFGEDLIYTWFQTMGIQPLEELTSDDADLITTALGGGLDTARGVAASGSSRYIHRALFY
jgi:hypothetical protein